MKKQRICKDCGTDQVIHRSIQDSHIDIVETMLCSPCLQSRAQRQTMKEDKLPFPKLLAKIRNETAKRVSSEIASVSGVDRLRWGRYKGVSDWYIAHNDIRLYWIEQLSPTTKETP